MEELFNVLYPDETRNAKPGEDDEGGEMDEEKKIMKDYFEKFNTYTALMSNPDPEPVHANLGMYDEEVLPYTKTIPDMKEWMHLVSGLMKKLSNGLRDDDNKAINATKTKILYLRGELAGTLQNIIDNKIPIRRHYRIEHFMNIQSVLECVHSSMEITEYCNTLQLIDEIVKKKDYSMINKFRPLTKVRVIFCVGFFRMLDKLLKRVYDVIFTNYVKIRGRDKKLMHTDERTAVWLCLMRLDLIISEMCYYDLLYGQKGLMHKKTSEYQNDIKERRVLDKPTVAFVSSGFGVYEMEEFEKNNMEQLQSKHEDYEDDPVGNVMDMMNLDSDGEEEDENKKKNSIIGTHDRLSSFLFHYNLGINESFYNLLTHMLKTDEGRNYLEEITEFTSWADRQTFNEVDVRFISKYYFRLFAVSEISVSQMSTEEVWRSISVLHSMAIKIERNLNYMLYMRVLWLRCCEIMFYEQDIYIYDDPVFNKTVGTEKEYELNPSGREIQETIKRKRIKVTNKDFGLKVEGIIFHHMVSMAGINMLRQRAMRKMTTILKPGVCTKVTEKFSFVKMKESLMNTGLAHGGLMATYEELKKWIACIDSVSGEEGSKDSLYDMYGSYFVSQFLLPGEKEKHIEENPLLNDDPRVVLSTHRVDEYENIEEDVRRLNFGGMLDRHIKVDASRNEIVYHMNDSAMKYVLLCRFILELCIKREQVIKQKLPVSQWLLFENSGTMDFYHRLLFNKKRKDPKCEETENPYLKSAQDFKKTEKDAFNSYKQAEEFLDDLKGGEIRSVEFPVVMWIGHVYYVLYKDSVLVRCFNFLDAVKTWFFLISVIQPEGYAIPGVMSDVFNISKELNSFRQYCRIYQ